MAFPGLAGTKNPLKETQSVSWGPARDTDIAVERGNRQAKITKLDKCLLNSWTWPSVVDNFALINAFGIWQVTTGKWRYCRFD